ncbi:TonB-dependent receptor [Sphingomonas sp. MG17]|uniref:TonB-dependent receptor n=1 Tax=Sphingomonas tagetis TaxID=2949092 RepID=A0A9X2HT26_9SPHN|nr:TonB-dependent receptor [Sphingomonas tagetis]MCP3732125.1 TonB-dependent receptor [Sphingomonas tagetis]
MALMVAISPVGANAQQATSEPASASPVIAEGEILVTAQRRAERIQDIPAAISALGSESLERAGIVSLDSVAPQVPSFYFGSAGASRPQMYIRGIGTRSFDPGSESSIGVFVDDVYLGRAAGSFNALRDIERIEVLRGPQGTLYGRNTIGGAVNVISKAPTSDFTGDFEVGVSNYGGYEGVAAVGGPLTGDGSLKFRAAGWRSYRDGYLTNLTTGTTFQGVDNWGGRLRLTWEATPEFKIDLTAEYGKDGNEAAFAGFGRGSGPTATTPANPSLVFFGRPGQVPIAYPGGRYEGYMTHDPSSDRDVQTYIGRIEYDAGFATLTSISAYRDQKLAEARDLDGTSVDALYHMTGEQTQQFTQEFRITSNPTGPASFEGALDWIIGGFYYHDDSARSDLYNVGVGSTAFALTGATQVQGIFGNYKVKSYAAFGQFTWHITDALDFTVGARYTHDKKSARQRGETTSPGVPLIPAPFDVTNAADYSSFDPRFVLDYKISRDVSVYASFSRGFKSGGFQNAAISAAQANQLFNPEKITAYEVGFRSEWLGRRLKLNISAFQYDYQDLQVSRFISRPGVPIINIISNAASSTVKGVDFELGLKPTDTLTFNFTYGYLDARYDDYIFDAATNFSGTRMVRSPEHSINVNGEWRVPIGDRRWFSLGGNYALLSTLYHEPGEGRQEFGGAAVLSREPGYGLLDLRASLEIDRFTVTAYVNNATKTYYRRTILAAGPTVIDYPGTPRVFGLRAAYRF